MDDRPYAKDLVMFVFLAAGIMNLLRQYPEAIRLMDDQANASGNGSLKQTTHFFKIWVQGLFKFEFSLDYVASKTETGSPSLALPYSNGPSGKAQTHIWYYTECSITRLFLHFDF